MNIRPDSSEYLRRQMVLHLCRNEGQRQQHKQEQRRIMREQGYTFRKTLIETYGRKCAKCGFVGALVIDHVLPVSKGGLSVIGNLQLLCRPCDEAKGDTYADYRKLGGK